MNKSGLSVFIAVAAMATVFFVTRAFFVARQFQLDETQDGR